MAICSKPLVDGSGSGKNTIATFTKAGYLAFISPSDVKELLELEAADGDVLGTSSKDEKGKYRPLIGLFLVQYLQGHYPAHMLEKAFTELDEGYCMSNKPHEIMGRMFRIAARMASGFKEAILADIKKCDSSWMRGGDRLDIFYDSVVTATEQATSILPSPARDAVMSRLNKCLDGMAKLKIRFRAFGEDFILHHIKATITGGPYTKLTNTVCVRVSVKLMEELMMYCFRLGYRMGYKSISDLCSSCLVQGDDICDLTLNSGSRFLWLKCADVVNLRFKAAQSFGSHAIVFLQRLVYTYFHSCYVNGVPHREAAISISRMLPRLFQSFPFKRELLLSPMDAELVIKTLCSTFLKGISRGMNLSELDLYIQSVADIYLGGNTVPINTNSMANGFGCGARDYLPTVPIAPDRYAPALMRPNLEENVLDNFGCGTAYFNQVCQIFTNANLPIPGQLKQYISKQATSKVRLDVELDKSVMKVYRDAWLATVLKTYQNFSQDINPIGVKRIQEFIFKIWDPAIVKRNAGEIVSFYDPNNPLQNFEAITAESPFKDALVLHYFVMALAASHGQPRPTLETYEELFGMGLLSKRGTRLLLILIEATTPTGGYSKILEKFGGASQFDPNLQKGNKNMQYTLAPLVAAREFLGTGGNPFQPYIDEDQRVFELQFAQYVGWQLLSRHRDDFLTEFTSWEVDKKRPLIAFSLIMRNVILILEDMRMGDCCVQGPMFMSKMLGVVNIKHDPCVYLNNVRSRDDHISISNGKLVATSCAVNKFVGNPITFVRKVTSSIGSNRVVKDGSRVPARRLTMLKAYSNF